MSFEEYLESVQQSNLKSRTNEAAAYSLLAPGKRVRPRLLFAALKDFGIDCKPYYPAGAAVEMVHCYSLIHDDLPAMDNDDYRRGKLTCHKAFDEATAILAGDALLTQAFAQASVIPASADKVVKIVKDLADFSGINGMIYGQDLDMSSENSQGDMKRLLDIDFYKTGKLLTLPLRMAAIIASKEEYLPVMDQIGEKLGCQFQIQDDILDATSTKEEMGKSLSDQDNNKLTAVSLLGLEQAKEQVERYSKEIQELLASINLERGNLASYIEQLSKRKK